ncbi:hypothetical protein MOQ72_02060 [Saccharopolyspora sp. K220]|uniref:hypothetical protein n=1 Tax=Saccharopolyspora soli TaxID=2926618 RepID=UPI001F56283E|nr:hypothetical protein [Saccharopolyspora soli]MCI2416195.1 hypothetical protein [Saccharopolyspora soli]
MLEIADKLGSVLSALIGLIGLVLTGYGLRLQRRAASPPTPAPPFPTPPAPAPPTPAPSAPAPPVVPPPEPPPEPEPERLEVPHRADWVPSPEHLPAGPAWGSDGYGGQPAGQQPAPWPVSPLEQRPDAWGEEPLRPRRWTLVVGLILLGVAVALGAVTWLL